MKVSEDSKRLWIGKTTVIFINSREFGYVTEYDGQGSGNYTWFSFDDPGTWMLLIGPVMLLIEIYMLFTEYILK